MIHRRSVPAREGLGLGSLNNPIMKPFLIFIALIGIAAVPASKSALKPRAPRLPNIVIIFTDDQGYADVGVFGAKGFETPNLDRLAGEGRIFRNFHVAQPVCSASRV